MADDKKTLLCPYCGSGWEEKAGSNQQMLKKRSAYLYVKTTVVIFQTVNRQEYEHPPIFRLSSYRTLYVSSFGLYIHLPIGVYIHL